ncbi:GNAT family N-acetyltransferase [Celerinatantimonas yamalensis]|uniref:GNAT family N-acetyltransferase n=1 Tax=Celerinatantimonas yamalensis TaxID=559956 RepID=A0ABW9G920_9GAMM
MLVLRAMQQAEYSAYCQYFVDDYSQEIVKNYGESLELAIELAKAALHRSFAHGLESSEHTLLCIDADVDGKLMLVGYLWHSVNFNERSTFIYDFFIFSEYRGLGFGKQAISALENQLQAVGVNQIKLRVAYHNERALKLYKDVGFVITGINLSKKIGVQSAS